MSPFLHAFSLGALLLAQDPEPAPPASAPAKFADATYEEAAEAPAAEAGAGAVEAGAKRARRSFTVSWPGSVGMGAARARGSAALAAIARTTLTASHRVAAAADEEAFDLAANASFVAGSDPAAEGTVRSGVLGSGGAIVTALALHPTAANLRMLGLAKPNETNDVKETKGKPGKRATELSVVRRGSLYPLSTEGHRLDAYFVRDASVAPEGVPTVDGFSIAGAGDRPRKFMRGHRFREGEGIIVGIRYSDPDGNTLRVSIELPKDPKGAIAVPSKGISVAITELSNDLEIGRTAERVTGTVAFNLETGGARVRIALDAEMRRVGPRDPERLLFFGEFHCVSLPLDELTPWLGRFMGGKPVLETFALPGEDDQ